MPATRGMKENLSELAEMWEICEGGAIENDLRKKGGKVSRAQKLYKLFQLHKTYPELDIKHMLFVQRSFLFGPLSRVFLRDLLESGLPADHVAKQLKAGPPSPF